MDKLDPSQSELKHWPNDWFLFVDGEIAGPVSAEKAFSTSRNSDDGKPILVSRKGFGQWYQLDDLASIYKMTGDAFQKLSSRLESATPPPPPREETRGQKVERKELKTELSPSMAKPASPATPLAKLKNQTSQIETTPAPLPAKESKARDEKAEKKASAKSSAKAKTKAQNSAVSPEKALLKEYFFQKGRMRLGRLRNPWISGFLGFPLTMGLFGIKWYRETSQDIELHLGENIGKAPPAIFFILPLVNIYNCIWLSKAILRVERQNKYESISVGLSSVFSVLPPFYIAYCQDALNRHWMKHVKFGLVSKK